MATRTTAKPSARERLLAAADELFYDEGVRTVGIDRVIEHAGVAKASLYNTFGSKDALIQAYLEGRHQRTAARITAYIEQFATPRERLLGVFDVQEKVFGDPAYQGCPFMRASAESRPGDVAQQAADAFRGWLLGLLTDLARQAGAADPAALARQLHLLYDGVSVAARMDRDPQIGTAARTAVEALLDAASQGRATVG